MSATLASWCLAAAVHFSPPARLPQFEGHVETVEQSTARYGSICTDIVAAVGEQKYARSWVALTLAWGVGESALSRDADLGPCHRKGAYRSRCDGGLAASIWQIHAHTSRETGERVTVEMLFASRPLAARTAYRGLVSSWSACRHLEPQDRYSQFGLGHCKEGHKSVRARFALYQRVVAWRLPEE